MSHSTDAPSHRLLCNPDEVQEAACLNGGQCFAVPGYGGNRHNSCKCPSMFTGVRCEEFYVPPEIPVEIQQGKIRTAHVTAAVSVCVLVFFVALLMIYVYIKKQRRMGTPANQINSNAFPANNGHSIVPSNNNFIVLSQTPLSNGKDDLDTSQTPLLIENETPKKNGGLLTSPPVNNNTVSEPSMDPDQSFNPDLDIGYIDETLPRRPKAKPKSQSAESQL